MKDDEVSPQGDIGAHEGVLPDGRPYRLEGWFSEGYTFVTANANDSPQVMREVERAVHKGITIVPFRIEDVVPSRSMEWNPEKRCWNCYSDNYGYGVVQASYAVR
ncbi:MAG TPA: hypothetical protein VMR52_13165 [Dehalococcoidia bacterium]|nr:hypothetical protein [Dehalococcoidia bacterium]